MIEKLIEKCKELQQVNGTPKRKLRDSTCNIKAQAEKRSKGIEQGNCKIIWKVQAIVSQNFERLKIKTQRNWLI